MNRNAWAILGGVIGSGVVTGVGVYLAIRHLQSDSFAAQTRTYVEGVAARAANDTLANDYGLTQQRIAQISQIASRFS